MKNFSKNLKEHAAKVIKYEKKKKKINNDNTINS